MSARPATLPASPYKGLAAYDDSELDALLFFGREREREIIAANLLAYPLTVLYGASGVGKSSVLRAGVAHHLRRQGVVVVVFDSWSADPVSGLLEAVRATLSEAFGDVDPSAGGLADSLATWCAELGCELYVVLDQTDEYFLYHEDDDEFERQFAQSATREGLPVHFLLAIRDDMLAKLDRFKGRIPNLLSNYLRLDHLDRDSARAAILGPIDRHNGLAGAGGRVAVEPELVEAVLDQTVAGRVTLVEGETAAEEPGRPGRVEAPYLQLVLQRLWEEERAGGSRILRLETLERLGGAAAIVRAHLSQALGALDRGEQDLAATLFNYLVTPSGTKIAHALGDLATYAEAGEGDVLPVLSTLVDERIVRPVGETGEQARYEIFHDVLAEPVTVWRTRHDAERRLEAERRAAERRHRRLLAVTIASLVALAAMALVTAFALTQRHEAQEQETRARARALLARAESQLDRNPTLGLRLAVAGARLDPTAQAEDTLRRALLASRLRRAERVGRGPVVGVDVAPSGRFGVAAVVDGTALVFGARTGRPVRKLDHGALLSVARISPDGRIVVTGGADGRVVAWNAAWGGLRHELAAGAAVTDAAFAPTGELAVAAADGSVVLWSPETGRTLARWATPSQPRQVLVSRGGGRVLVVGADTRARLYTPGRHSGRLLEGTGVLTAAMTADGKMKATAARDGTVRLWVGARTRPRTLAKEWMQVTHLEFGRLGGVLAASSLDGSARIWRMPEGDLVTKLVGHKNGVDGLAISPDETLVATRSADGTSRLWTASEGDRLAVLPGAATDVDFTAKYVVATGGEDGWLRIWDAAVDPRLRLVGKLDAPVTALAASSGRILAGSAGSGPPVSAALFMRGGFATAEPAPVPAVGFRDGAALVLVTGRSSARVVDVRGDRTVARLPAGGVTAAGFAPDGAGLATFDGRTVRVWDGSGHLVRALPATGVTRVALSREARLVAAGSESGRTLLWDVESGRRVASLAGHEGEITGLAFSRDGKLLVTTSTDHDARLWDVGSGRMLHRLQHFAPVSGAAFSPDGRWVVTAGPAAGGLWEVRSGSRLLYLRGHKGPLRSVAFAPGGYRIVSGGQDGTVRRYTCDVCGSIADLLRLAEARIAAARG